MRERVLSARLRDFVRACAFITATAGAVLCPMGARATLVYNLDGVFNGATPTSTPPYLTASFATVIPSLVVLTLTSSLETPSEFIDAVAFNVSPSITPSSLTITPFVGNSGFTNPTVLKTTDNAQNLLGGGAQAFGFDVMFNFSAAPPSARFNGTDVANFLISGVPTLTENDFNFTNSADDLTIAAHVQGIPCTIGPTCPTGTTSGAIRVAPPVPEPASIALLGAALVGIGIIRRRRTERRGSN